MSASESSSNTTTPTTAAAQGTTFENHRIISRNAFEVRQSTLGSALFWSHIAATLAEFLLIVIVVVVAFAHDPQPKVILEWRMSGIGLLAELISLVIGTIPLVYFYHHSLYGLVSAPDAETETETFRRMRGLNILARYFCLTANTILALSLFDGQVKEQSPLMYWTGLGVFVYHITILMLPLIALILLLCCLPCWLAILNRLFPEPGRGASPDVIRSLPSYVYNPSVEEYGLAVIKKDEDATCAICLQEYKSGNTLRVLACRHHYHQRCADEWFKLQATCPLCQRHILDPEMG